MGEATEYEERIARALARIAQAAAARRKAAAEAGAGANDAPDPAVLEELRATNGLLEEDITRLRQQAAALEAAHEAEREASRNRLAAMDEALQSLRAAQSGLTGTIAELRKALADQVAEPELVNRAMQAEIEALTAQRRADLAEIDAVLAELAPLVDGGTANASG